MAESGANYSGRRPTRLIVDTRVIERNARIIAGQLSHDTRLMAVVKANAYGHGAVDSAQAALRGGATALGVATVSEAAELRDSAIDSAVLVLGSSDPTEAPMAARLRVAIGVGDRTQAGRLLATLEAVTDTPPLEVHLKIDTGMRRFGVLPADAPQLARMLNDHPAVQLAGVYSHFAEADQASPTRMVEQFDTFRETLSTLSAMGTVPGIAHISNSAALLRNRSTDMDMVRAGICLYGITPSENDELFEGMRSALEWRATVQHIASMSPGDRTGYGGTYVATEHERIAILPVGYADGYPRSLSNVGWVGFQGYRLPIRGRISMDQCVVGIPAALNVQVGDEVTLIGNPASGAPTANELAATIGTIGYEIVARLSRRIPVDYL
jgi:alanine racemase